jgi:hypothetical protein
MDHHLAPTVKGTGKGNIAIVPIKYHNIQTYKGEMEVSN